VRKVGDSVIWNVVLAITFFLCMISLMESDWFSGLIVFRVICVHAGQFGFQCSENEHLDVRYLQWVRVRCNW
jgi:hypothetical protein